MSAPCPGVSLGPSYPFPQREPEVQLIKIDKGSPSWARPVMCGVQCPGRGELSHLDPLAAIGAPRRELEAAVDMEGE